MKLLVMGAGMMGAAAAYDMARAREVEAVTLADIDLQRAQAAADRMNQLSRTRKIRAVAADAAKLGVVGKLMRQHDGTLSCVPYSFNPRLAKAALEAGCHFADLGGNHTVVRQELALARKAEKSNLAIAPDCGLSPGMASILAGELMRRMGGKAESLEIFAGGLPSEPKWPWQYQLGFSAEGLINEYVEPCRILRRGKITEIEPLTELETFLIKGFPPLDAFHTSGGTSTLPDTFQGKVRECFEKTLRYQGHYALLRALYELGLFSSKPIKVGDNKARDRIVPRRLLAKLLEQKLAGNQPDVVILRVEAHNKNRMAAFNVVDHYDKTTKMTAMMRTTAWPASVVLRMLVSGVIGKRGGIYQELDVPFDQFSAAMASRGVKIEFSQPTEEKSVSSAGA